jgi:hypothetical protein
MHINSQQQRIVEEAAKIAAPLGEEYKAEARKIRLPYAFNCSITVQI